MLSWLFPARCLVCGKVIPGGEYFCPACWETVPKTPLTRSLPLPGEPGKTLAVYAPLPYDGGYRLTIHQFKFQGQRALAKPLGRLMAESLSRDRGFDTVTWVPMTGEGKRARGYDQSELLARAAAKSLKLPCLPLLEKARATRTQHELSRRDRMENVQNAYRASRQASKELAGKRILLIDDIVTTGATLLECARVLYQTGALSVTGLCAADAPPPQGD